MSILSSTIVRLILILTVLIFIIWLFHRRKKYSFLGLSGVRVPKFKLSSLSPQTYYRQRPKRPLRSNKTEEKCRRILEKIYNRRFSSVRPDFLKSPRTKKNLELDCYNSDLKIALEYNGRQHYAYTPVFHRSKQDFFNQVHKDDFKRKRCQELGIKLIEIPYWVTDINLEDYIKRELTKCGALPG